MTRRSAGQDSSQVVWTYTDTNGCEITLQSAYEVLTPEIAVFIPTAFSPNNDGINDIFRPFATEQFAINYHIEVFDRWGGLVFSGGPDTGQEGSDGRVNNQQAPHGSYAWRVIVYQDSHVLAERAGKVILVQ